MLSHNAIKSLILHLIKNPFLQQQNNIPQGKITERGSRATGRDHKGLHFSPFFLQNFYWTKTDLI